MERLSHIMGPHASQDLRSPSPIMAPESIQQYYNVNRVYQLSIGLDYYLLPFIKCSRLRVFYRCFLVLPTRVCIKRNCDGDDCVRRTPSHSRLESSFMGQRTLHRSCDTDLPSTPTAGARGETNGTIAKPYAVHSLVS